MLEGDAVALAAQAVARDGDGAVVVRQSSVLHHGLVPQECKRTLLGLHRDTNEMWVSPFHHAPTTFSDLIGCFWLQKCKKKNDIQWK